MDRDVHARSGLYAHLQIDEEAELIPLNIRNTAVSQNIYQRNIYKKLRHINLRLSF